MAGLSLRHMYKIYPGNVKAVSDFNLEIDDKEFVVFVGPSGCGKSTTLRMVAGLEEISAGELYIDGKLVNDVEPKDRDIAMVFQNYALYPHMTVYDNMAFGLRLRKMNSKEIDARVKEAAKILNITSLLARKPKALSGGQRQRVALGRAIVREPKVFLLDEPLSNLDAKLRVQMRTEITKLHNKLATTFIYVTHDQTEAMTMGTRIVVMKDGVIQQVDTPTAIYDNPENLFVASFLGSPQMNFFNSRLSWENGSLYATLGADRIKIPMSRAKRLMDESYIGKDVVMGIRPEDIHDEEVFIASSPDTVVSAEIDVVEKLGNETILYMKVEGKDEYTVARIDARNQAKAGDIVKLAIDAKHIHFFDPETELTIMGVPKVNMIPAQLIAENSGDASLAVRFGDVKIDLGSSIYNKLVDTTAINTDVVLGIPPAELKTEYEEGDFEIAGKVDFIENYPRYTAAYTVVPGKKGYIVAKLPLDTAISSGDSVKYYVSADSIQLYNDLTGEKMIASLPASTNVAEAMVTVKDSVASVTFGRSKLSFPSNSKIRESGAVSLYISPYAITAGKEEIAKSPKCVMVGRVAGADTMGDYTLVYFNIEGFAPYFSAMMKGKINYNIGDKVKLAVNSDEIYLGKRPSIKSIIEEKAAEAPKYSFKAAPEVSSIYDAVTPTSTETVEDAMTAAKAAAKKPAPAKKPASSAVKKAPAKKPTTKK